VPGADAYEGFPQLDNGVGMIRDFVEEIESDIDAFGIARALGNVRILTGRLGERVFTDYVFPLLQAKGVRSLPEVVTAKNEFFGADVTCSGLLVGADMIAAVERHTADAGQAKVVLIPPNCLNHEGVTIDDMTPEDMGEALGATVVAPEESFVQTLQEYAEGSDTTE
jgi:NifB/MoaA-like Fe-S oxidoreductase